MTHSTPEAISPPSSAPRVPTRVVGGAPARVRLESQAVDSATPVIVPERLGLGEPRASWVSDAGDATVIGFEEGTALLRTSTAKLLTVLPLIGEVSFSPGGELFAIATNRGPGRAHLFDASSGEFVQAVGPFFDGEVAYTFESPRRLVVTAADGRASLVEVDEGAPLNEALAKALADRLELLWSARLRARAFEGA